MKNLLKYTTLCLLLASYTFIQAQEQFKVLNMAGTVKILVNENELDIVTGSWLKGDVTLILGEESYIGLISDKGQAVEIRENGSYSIKNLQQLAALRSESSLAAKYADYLLHGNTEQLIERIKATGAVERSNRTEKNAIEINLTEKSKFFSDKLLISWQGDTGKSYEVIVTDLYDKQLSVIRVQGTETEIDLSQYSDVETFLVQVKLSSRKKVSEKVALQRLTAEERATHTTALQSLQTNNGSALDEFIRGTYFAEHGLYADAFSCFARAVKLAPDVLTYNAMYNQWFAINSI